MSSKTTVIWLLVAIVLGAAALLILRSSGGSGAAANRLNVGDRLIALDPATVVNIDVRHPDGGSESLSRTGAMEWSMIVRPAGAAIGANETLPAWPVVSSRVQALLRHLSDATVRALPEKNATMGDRAVVIEVRASGTPTPDPLTIRLSELSVAGKSMIEVERGTPGSSPSPIRAVIDDQLHLIFRDHAPREWRDRQALYGLGVDASRVTLDNDKAVHLALGKVDGAWAVREPVSAPADPAVIQRLLNSIAAVQIVDFLDQGVATAGTRLDQPAASVTVETDQRDPAAGVGATSTQRRRLELGGASDAAGTRLFARVDGERTVIIDARAVADLKLEPTVFIWPYPTRLSQSDIGTIAIEAGTSGDSAITSASGVIFKRNLDKWMQIRPDGQTVQLSSTDTPPVQAILAFLCGPAEGAGKSSTSPPPGPLSIALSPMANYKVLGRVTLLSLSGGPLDNLEIGSGQSGVVTIRTGPVYRTWGLDRVPSRIAEFVAAATSPPTTPGQADATPEPSK